MLALHSLQFNNKKVSFEQIKFSTNFLNRHSIDRSHLVITHDIKTLREQTQPSTR